MTAILPVNISFTDWANELRNSFPAEDIPIVKQENEWKSFVKSLLLNRAFNGKNIPFPDGFVDWKAWAAEFLLSIGA